MKFSTDTGNLTVGISFVRSAFSMLRNTAGNFVLKCRLLSLRTRHKELAHLYTITPDKLWIVAAEGLLKHLKL